MGKDTELFKAAQSGNTLALEKAFASQLKKLTGAQHATSSRSKLHPNIQDAAGSTLLHHAILNGHSDTVSLLLKCGASTKISDNSGSPPLHLAAWKGDLEIVKKLVTQGPSYANVNQQNDSDETALHLASQYGYASVVEFLLQRHADPLLRNTKNETPLDLAAQYGHLSCVHYLISFSPETLRPTLKGFSPLHLAARNGHSIVALSLINAGISINTVCERGTALHEAALCGKTETVELLLDKGVNTELKDVEGRTAMEVLGEFSANKAHEIQRKIENHMREQDREMKHRVSHAIPVPTTSRVIAIARTTSQPLVEGSSALAFHTGDHIQVELASGGGVYVGTVRGKAGSFLAEDVLFYTEQGGHLVSTAESDLNMIHRNPSPGPAAETKPLLVMISEEESVPKVLEDDTPLSTTPLSLKKSSTSSDTLTISPDDAHLARSDIFEMSISTSGSRQSGTHEPTNSDPSEGHPIKKSDGSRKLSKKEKIFQLSRDDGKYAELNPINPHEAKKEFGDKLVLRPTSALVEGVSPLEDREAESAVPGPHDDEGLMGAYYVLEVGNFDLPQSPNPDAMEQGHEVEGEGSDMPLSSEGECRYFTVNTNDKSGRGQRTDGQAEDGEDDGRGFYASLPSNHGNNTQSYENVDIRQRLKTEGSKVNPTSSTPNNDVGGGSVLKLHPHMVMVDQGDDGNYGNIPPASGTSRSSTYENITPPVGVANDTASGGRFRYENVEALLHKSPSTSSTVNSTPSTTTSAERSEVKRSARQRKEAYEVVPLKNRKSSTNHHDDHHSDLPSSPSPALVSEPSLIKIHPGEDPFTGLIMTTSHPLEGGCGTTEDHTPSSEGGEHLWDSTEEEVEWTQIADLLENIGTMDDHTPSPQSLMATADDKGESPVGEGCGTEVAPWLASGEMSGYLTPLVVNGFDNLRFLGGNILSMDDLPDLGISQVDDQYNLMASVSLLALPPSVSHASNVVEWLALLDLSCLEGNFKDYSLQKITFLWDIELTSVVGVVLLGYRKRLLYGISELRHAHPEWAGQNTFPGSSPKKKISPKKSQRASFTPLTSKMNFLKDYRSYRSTSPPSSTTPPSIKMRTPAEAQSHVVEGRATRNPTLPSQSWKHNNDDLIKDCINYNVKYLGSVLIKYLHGDQSAEEACLKLRTATQDMHKIPEIILSITWKGVKFMDAKTKNVVSVHSIRDVSCCCLDIEEKNVFAYITKDRTMGKHYSHVFMAPSQNTADEIRMTLGQAFEICYQKVMSVRNAAMATNS